MACHRKKLLSHVYSRCGCLSTMHDMHRHVGYLEHRWYSSKGRMSLYDDPCKCRGDLQAGWHKHTPGSPRRGLPSALAKAAPVIPVVAPASPHLGKKKDSRKQMKVEVSAPSHSLATHPTHSMTGTPRLHQIHWLTLPPWHGMYPVCVTSAEPYPPACIPQAYI